MPLDADYIIHAYKFDGKGKSEKLDPSSISKELEMPNLAWAHFDACMPQTREWLDRELSYLDPFITEALMAEKNNKSKPGSGSN